MCYALTKINTKVAFMARVPSVRIHFKDGTSLEMPENDSVQVVLAGPAETPEEGWTKISGEASPALFGKVLKSRAAALKQGHKVVTFRGVLEVDGARRV